MVCRSRLPDAPIYDADIVCCRYLLEHCHDPLAALGTLRQLLSADGLLIVEVPDSEKFLSACDYSFLWEEHVSYFTDATLLSLLSRHGFQSVSLRKYNFSGGGLAVCARRGSRRGVISEGAPRICSNRDSRGGSTRGWAGILPSPGGATECSPWRQPREKGTEQVNSPGGA